MLSKGSRRLSLLMNTLFSMFSWGLPVLIGLVATPLIVNSLGYRDYGLYAIIIGFVGYSFSFGVGKVLIKYIAEFRAAGENEKIGEFVSATFWFSLAIAVAGTILTVILTRMIVTEILLLPAEQQKAGEVGLYLACAAIIASMISQIFQYILQGLNSFSSFLLLTNISGVLLNAGNVTLALLGFGIEALLMWNVAAIGLMGMAFAADAVRKLPEFSLKLNFRSNAWPQVLRYGSSIILYQVFGNALLAFERAWVVRKFGSEAATFYVVPMTLAIYMQGIVGSSILVLFPLVNELLTDRPRLISLYEKATKMMIALIFFIAAALIFGGGPLLQVWVGGEIASRSYTILVIHTLTFALNASIMIVWQLAEGFRFPGYNTLVAFVWMVVAIPVMILSADAWNIEGIAFGRFLGVFLTLPLIIIVEKRCLGGIRGRFWGAILWRIAAATAVMAICLVASFRLIEISWITTAAVFAFSSAAYVLSLVAVGFFTAEEKEVIGKLIFRPGT